MVFNGEQSLDLRQGVFTVCVFAVMGLSHLAIPQEDLREGFICGLSVPMEIKENIDDLDPDVDGISELQNNPEDIAAVVAFLKSLTDERVRRQSAPFDHPEITIPHGHSGVSDGVALDQSFTLPAVGRNGGPAIRTFLEVLED